MPDDETIKEQHTQYSVITHAQMIFTNPNYGKLTLMCTIGLMFGSAYGSFFPLYARETLGLSLAQYGEVVVVAPLMAFVVYVPGGYLVDRIGPKYLVFAGFVMNMIAAVSIVCCVHDANGLFVTVLFQAIGGSLNGASVMPLIMLTAADHERGKVFGLIQFCRSIGAFLTVPVIGFLADTFHTYRVGYAVCASLACCGAITVLFIPNPKHNSSHQ